jgi:hypothetical protein
MNRIARNFLLDDLIQADDLDEVFAFDGGDFDPAGFTTTSFATSIRRQADDSEKVSVRKQRRWYVHPNVRG